MKRIPMTALIVFVVLATALGAQTRPPATSADFGKWESLSPAGARGGFSPDGRWLAYDSDETGTSEIYVRSFPQPGEKYRVSTAGGIGAQWSRDGKELLIWTSGQIFYPTGSVYSADVETTPTFQAGTPHLLFIPRQDNGGLVATSDLKRFLAVVPAEGAAAPAITVTLNWQTALER